jgi:hypothetical protein
MPSGLKTAEVRALLVDACAIAHDKGYRMPLLELCMLIHEKGLPNAEERKLLLARKKAAGEHGDISPHSPS